MNSAMKADSRGPCHAIMRWWVSRSSSMRARSTGSMISRLTRLRGSASTRSARNQASVKPSASNPRLKLRVGVPLAAMSASNRAGSIWW